MALERLQKILAHAGIASRRAAEGLITSGQVRVNGRVVTELGVSADAHKDKIEVDGKRVVLEKPIYVVFHKPRGMVSTLKDPEGRPSLGDAVGKMGARVYPIGRLDFHTSGVLLLTNDGELTDALLHPRKDVPKIYVAKLRGHVGVEELDLLRNGVVLDDGYKTKKADVFVLREEDRNTWVQFTLYEGKNRQIHRMGDAIRHPVLRLARTSFAGIDSEDLRPGAWRELTTRELDKLMKTYVTPVRKANDNAPAEPAPRRASAAREEHVPERVIGPGGGRRGSIDIKPRPARAEKPSRAGAESGERASERKMPAPRRADDAWPEGTGDRAGPSRKAPSPQSTKSAWQRTAAPSSRGEKSGPSASRGGPSASRGGPSASRGGPSASRGGKPSAAPSRGGRPDGRKPASASSSRDRGPRPPRAR